MCGTVRYRDAESTLPATCRTVSSEMHRATSAKLAPRNDHRNLQISHRVTFGCFLLLNWPKRDAFRNHGGHQIEGDGRTLEDSKRSLPPVLPTMTGLMEQECVRAQGSYFEGD
jgi:hypothetical protein